MTVDEKTKWYCLNGNGDIVYLGQFSDFDLAAEAADDEHGSVIWVFDRATAHEWRDQLVEFLA